MEGKIIKRRRSKEEIAELIELYESSGLTMRQWGDESGIPLSTLSGWLRRRTKKRESEEVRFVSLSPEITFSEEEVLEANPETTFKAGEPGIIVKLSNCQIYLGDSILCGLGIITKGDRGV